MLVRSHQDDNWDVAVGLLARGLTGDTKIETAGNQGKLAACKMLWADQEGAPAQLTRKQVVDSAEHQRQPHGVWRG